MSFFWVTFDDDSAVCVEAETTSKARGYVADYDRRPIVSCIQIPNPAAPRWMLKEGDRQSTCYSPLMCAGRVRCPRRTDCAGSRDRARSDIE